MSEWQPFDTAPTDGSDLLATDGSRVILTSFDTLYRTWPDAGWERLTHWMPLPEPPDARP